MSKNLTDLLAAREAGSGRHQCLLPSSRWAALTTTSISPALWSPNKLAVHAIPGIISGRM